MSDFAGAVANRISEQPTAGTFLARWDFGDGTVPAVFTTAPAPPTCGNPVCVVTESGGSEDQGGVTRSTRTIDVEIEVQTWTDKSGSEQALRAWGWLLWSVFHRCSELSVDGWSVIAVEATPPRRIEDGDGYPGCQLTLRVRAEEAA